MGKLKNHALLFSLIAAIVVIGVMSGSIYAKKDQGTFDIKDLLGTREAIADIVISGDLKDGYHRTGFRIEQGQVKTSTVLLEQPIFSAPRRYNPGSNKWMDGFEYYISNGGLLYEIVANDKRGNVPIPIGTATVSPHVNYTNKDPQDTSVSYTNYLEYGLAKIGEKVYFTLPTTRGHTGENGIYELKFSDNWGYRGITGDSGLEARTVTTFSLDKNKPGLGTSIEILGLEAVGSSLALIAVEDNQLVVRSYDSDSGNQLGELIIPHFFLAGRPKADLSENSGGETYYEIYEAISDNDQNMLHLSFNRSSSLAAEAGTNNKTMISIDFANGMKLNEMIKESFTEGEEDNYSGVLAMSYRNGKFYVVKTMKSRLEEGNQPIFDIALPRRFMIYVYQASKVIYKGELITDLNDDNIRAINVSPQDRGFGYNQSDYRFFDSLHIE